MNTVIYFLIMSTSVGMIQLASAEVFVPENELVTYFDSVDTYTIAGAVKNTENYPVIPTLHLTLNDNGKQTFITQILPTVFPNTDIPFKIKIPEVSPKNITIKESHVTFEKNLAKSQSGVSILYDRSMVKHSDGHLVGRILNNGNVTEYNLKVYATIHGANNTFIDSTKNLESINKIEPGQILNFTMYPDPTVAKNVSYYSCFVIGDDTVIEVSTIRNGEKFNFRYDSTASFVAKGFDETGTQLSIAGINSIKFPTYVNFEFPKISGDEKFTVSVDGKPVKFLQSQDDEGNWHVAFDIDGSSQNQILISGFGKPGLNNLPDNVTTNGEQNYLAYFVVIAAATIGVGIYLYSKKKTKITTN